jgi:uncharacterized protein
MDEGPETSHESSKPAVIEGQPQDYSGEVHLIANRVLRGIVFTGGAISLVLGFIGIFLPLLPTTPFLLLSALLFSKSSVRYYNWLMNHKRLGPYLRNYHEGKGIPLRAKIYSIGFLWLTIGTSAYFVMKVFEVRIVLIIVAIGVSLYLLSIPTYTEEQDESPPA